VGILEGMVMVIMVMVHCFMWLSH